MKACSAPCCLLKASSAPCSYILQVRVPLWLSAPDRQTDRQTDLQVQVPPWLSAPDRQTDRQTYKYECRFGYLLLSRAQLRSWCLRQTRQQTPRGFAASTLLHDTACRSQLLASLTGVGVNSGIGCMSNAPLHISCLSVLHVILAWTFSQELSA